MSSCFMPGCVRWKTQIALRSALDSLRWCRFVSLIGDDRRRACFCVGSRWLLDLETDPERYGVEGPVLSLPPNTELVVDDDAVSSREKLRPDTDDVSLGLDPRRRACEGWIVDDTDEYKSDTRNGEVRPEAAPSGWVGDGKDDMSRFAGAIDWSDDARDRAGDPVRDAGYEWAS